VGPGEVAAVLKENRVSAQGRPGQVNWVMAELLLVIMVGYVCMVYEQIAAFLVELFPARIRYTATTR
jgi:hypothetical protein